MAAKTKRGKDAEAAVQKLYFSSVSVAGGNSRAAACSVYADLDPISREIGVKKTEIVRILKGGTGYSPADCRRGSRGKDR